MKKLMDIIANWHKGKKAHDKKVFDHEAAVANLNNILDEIQKQIHIQKVFGLLTPIRHWCKEGDKELEAKHWQVLAEYAQDQVKALTTIKSNVMPDDQSNGKFDPTKDQYVGIWACNCPIKPEISQSVIERAERRHGYGIQS